jgi:hypothetical protein
MDPRKLFSDERLRGICVYCCATPDTRDHVPSKVLLDDPLPSDVSVVECCSQCNASFSLDEEYLATFIECVVCGTTNPADVSRDKICRVLEHTPALASLIAQAEFVDEDGQQLWRPDETRVMDVLVKLARGHAAHELDVLPPDDPIDVRFAPISMLDDQATARFVDNQETPFFPEIGSREFIRAFKEPHTLLLDQWRVVQKGRYEYLVTQVNGTIVRMLFSDYLAAEVHWD